MSSFRQLALILVLTVSSAHAYANLIFNFEIDTLSQMNINGHIGDQFSIAIDDKADLASGVEMSDILWVSLNTVHLGYQLIDGFQSSNSDSTFAQFFTFSELSSNVWQLDILTGVTGNSGIMTFQKGSNSLQFGQTDDGQGATSLAMLSATGSIFSHDISTARVFSAQASLIPEPGSFSLLVIGLLGVSRLWRIVKK